MASTKWQFVTAAGRKLLFEKQSLLSNAHPVLFLHHATGSIPTFRSIRPKIASKYQFLAYNRQGFGENPEKPEPWSLNYHMEDAHELVQILDNLSIELGFSSISIVGHSDGATLSLLAAAMRPKLIKCIVAESPHMWYEKSTLIPGFAQFAKEVAPTERFIKSLRRDHGENGNAVLRRWQSRWTDPAFEAWNIRDQLQKIQCPVFIAHGALDLFFPLSHSEAILADIKANPHSPPVKLTLFQKSGHTPHGEIAEDIQLFENQVMDFLNANCNKGHQLSKL